MKHIFEDIHAKDVPEALKQSGFSAHQPVRVTIEPIEADAAITETLSVAAGESLKELILSEPDLYDESDIMGAS